VLTLGNETCHTVHQQLSICIHETVTLQINMMSNCCRGSIVIIWPYHVCVTYAKLPNQYCWTFQAVKILICYRLTVLTSWSSSSQSRLYKFSLESAFRRRRSLVWSWSPLGFEPDRLCAAGTRRGDLGGRGGGVVCWEESCKGFGRGGRFGGGLRSNTCWCRSVNRCKCNQSS